MSWPILGDTTKVARPSYDEAVFISLLLGRELGLTAWVRSTFLATAGKLYSYTDTVA